MKAILILNEIPKICADCPLSYFADLEDPENDMMHCTVHNGYMEDAFRVRAVWCPLKPMPKEKDGTFRWVGIDGADESYIHGWNDCLEEIEK